ncbi:hypothetical protein DFH08DRAFT_820994 [Mycena albidolilacea]|uniref:Uncharacterized protein n=1 Tax=Mycena albidolilacea TaxID=1033008 RepID=A0AAD6ZBY0_9AGAR|nr:hypothetical protein DFH08DRAFT_820994 [Mycena albidolilacea]
MRREDAVVVPRGRVGERYRPDDVAATTKSLIRVLLHHVPTSRTPYHNARERKGVRLEGSAPDEGGRKEGRRKGGNEKGLRIERVVPHTLSRVRTVGRTAAFESCAEGVVGRRAECMRRLANRIDAAVFWAAHLGGVQALVGSDAIFKKKRSFRGGVEVARKGIQAEYIDEAVRRIGGDVDADDDTAAAYDQFSRWKQVEAALPKSQGATEVLNADV